MRLAATLIWNHHQAWHLFRIDDHRLSVPFHCFLWTFSSKIDTALGFRLWNGLQTVAIHMAALIPTVTTGGRLGASKDPSPSHIPRDMPCL